jgi:hypothetical protein
MKGNGSGFTLFVRNTLRNTMDFDPRTGITFVQGVIAVVCLLISPLCLFAEQRTNNFVCFYLAAAFLAGEMAKHQCGGNATGDGGASKRHKGEPAGEAGGGGGAMASEAASTGGGILCTAESLRRIALLFKKLKDAGHYKLPREATDPHTWLQARYKERFTESRKLQLNVRMR